MNVIKRTLVCLLFAVIAFGAFAQEVEYKMEIGGMLGGSFYMGDANYTRPFKGMRPAGAVIARQIFNPHMAVKYDFAVAGISGSTADFKNKFPAGQDVKFKRTLFDIGAQFEYNFLSYGTGKGFKNTRRITPYILGGVGLTFAPAPADAVVTLNFPVGMGVKYKLAERLNLGFEWTMRFSMSDRLDVSNKNGLQLNDPYNIKSRGIKNKDSYSFIMVSLTYDLLPRLQNCNNL